MDDFASRVDVRRSNILHVRFSNAELEVIFQSSPEVKQLSTFVREQILRLCKRGTQ